jgi:hypothetical protein
LALSLPGLALPSLTSPDGETIGPRDSEPDALFDSEYTPVQDQDPDTNSDPHTPSDEDPNLHTVSQRGPRGTLPDATPGQQARFDIAQSRAREATETLRQIDPQWRAPQSFTRPSREEGVETTIRRTEGVAQAAEARLQELLRDAIPGTNPTWGVSRLRKELYDRGFVFSRETRAPGSLYQNPATGEQVRIMEQPHYRRRSDPQEKFNAGHYYRYRPDGNTREGRHVPIPDKPQRSE